MVNDDGTSQGSLTYGPSWDPEGRTTYCQWIREVGAWRKVTSSHMIPTAQAAALQLEPRGMTRKIVVNIPPAAITHGAANNDTLTDLAAHLLHTLGNCSLALEEE